jgi:hypothetical protein
LLAAIAQQAIISLQAELFSRRTGINMNDHDFDQNLMIICVEIGRTG